MSEGANAIFKFIVEDDDEGSRLDALVAAAFPGISRTLVGRLIRENIIQVDGVTRKPSFRVTPGESVSGSFPPFNTPLFAPEAIDIDILHEDAECLVINKPPGMVVHPGPGHSGGTLANALLYHYPGIRNVGGIETRPGIVHRLDKDTSGVMVVARTDSAHHALTRQFKERFIRKSYLGFVYGLPVDEGTITLPIGRHPGQRKKMTACDPVNPRDAETRWRVVGRYCGISLVAFQIATGRTHQIRVHCAKMRHPIVGDMVYGVSRPGRSFSLAPKTAMLASSVKRHLLHASRISFTQPATGEMMTFESPLPADMLAFQKALEAD